MYQLLRAVGSGFDGRLSGRFEGEPHGAPISFFLQDDAPGRGPRLHRHPYPETFVVQLGRVCFTVGDEQVEAAAGDVVVVPAGVPHGFVNPGPERLGMVAIHCAGRMETEWLE
jgi:mannose-6-phosphate isomerase-like protein (cupin superfamily)